MSADKWVVVPVEADDRMKRAAWKKRPFYSEEDHGAVFKATIAARPTGHDVPVLVDQAELEALRSRVRDLERALGPALTREAEDMGLYDEDRADTIGQNGNDGLHYVEADAGPTPLRGRVTRRSE